VKVKVSASFGGTLPVGDYSNMRPSFAAEIEFDSDLPNSELEIDHNQKALHKICYDNFKLVAEVAKIEKIKNDRSDFRWYERNGKQYISVTSFLGFDETFSIPDNELKQYAAQGTIIHAQIDNYLRTGKWQAPEEIEGMAPYVMIIKSGSLSLALEGWDFVQFLQKYTLTQMERGTPVFNDRWGYAGLPDITTSIYNGVRTLADIKRTPNKIKGFMQCACYEMARREMGMEPNKQLMLIPINDKTIQGFSKPLVTEDIDKYFEMAIYKRKQFSTVYGI